MKLSDAVWAYVRPIIAISLLCIVGYLAIEGSQEARSSLVASFTVLVGALWGERAALKVPGGDEK